MLTGTIDMPALVAKFYEAAVDPTRWTVAWRLLASYLQAGSGAMFIEDAVEHARRIVVVVGDGAAAYEAYPPAFGLSDDDTRRAYEGFTTGLLGAIDVLVGVFEVERGCRLIAAFHRCAGSIPFDQVDARLLQGSISHLAGALRQMVRLEQERGLATYPTIILDNLPWGTILLSVDGAVLMANRTAVHLCGPDGLLIISPLRGVEAQIPAENLRLQSLIGGVRAGDDGGVLQITRPPPQTALAVRVYRVPAVPRETLYRALLIVRELSRRPAARGVQVKELFGLTTAESEVLDELLDGLTARAIAAKRNVSLYTVQAQVRHILAKTGAEKMRDLVRMMAALFG